MKVFDKLGIIQSQIGDSSNCELYEKCVNDLNSPWDQIFLVENLRRENSRFLKHVFKKHNSLLTLFLLRLNAKFRFRNLRKALEILHIILETHRLIKEVERGASNILIEGNRFNMKNSILFFPSLKKTICNFNFLYFYPKINLRFKYEGDLFFHNSLSSAKSIEKIVIKKCIRKLESSIINSSISSLYVGGTMNLLNRILALIFLKNNLKVYYQDHGLVRDCCAEFGIFSDAIPYKKDGIKAKQEITL